MRVAFEQAWVLLNKEEDIFRERPLLDPRRTAPSEYEPNSRTLSQFETWMGNRGLSLDNLSEWTHSELDIAQKHATSAEIHQMLSDERARRGYNIIPKNQMVDVGRDPQENPMPPNRKEYDYIDSVRGDFGDNLRRFQQLNAGEPMNLAWQLLKARGEPKKREEMRQIADTFHDESKVNHAQRVKQILEALPNVKEMVSQITGKPPSKYKNVPVEAKETKDDDGVSFEGGKAVVPFQVTDRPLDVGNPQFAVQMGDARNPNNPNYKEFFDTGKIPDYDERESRRMNRQAEIDREWADLDARLFGEAEDS